MAISPEQPWYPDGSPVTLGMKFRSDVAGAISGIRFYNGSPQNNGTHIGLLYSASGALLAQAAFHRECVGVADTPPSPPRLQSMPIPPTLRHTSRRRGMRLRVTSSPRRASTTRLCTRFQAPPPTATECINMPGRRSFLPIAIRTPTIGWMPCSRRARRYATQSHDSLPVHRRRDPRRALEPRWQSRYAGHEIPQRRRRRSNRDALLEGRAATTAHTSRCSTAHRDNCWPKRHSPPERSRDGRP